MNKSEDLIKKLNSNKKIMILGSAILDMLIKIDTLPKSGEDITGIQKETNVGGCAYNISKILNHLNINHDLFVPIGTGIHADIIKKQLLKDNRNLFAEDECMDNGWCLSFVENGGERTFVTIQGIETNWKPEWFNKVTIKDYDYIYISGYQFQEGGNSGNVILKALENKKESCLIIFDPGPRVKNIDKKILKKLLTMNTILELNKMELILLSGEEDIDKAARKLYDITNNPVIATLGGDGTLYCTSQGTNIVPSKKVDVVDTIGAGDSHTAAFMSGIASGFSIEESCILGNEVASKVVQNSGCTITL
ncbi:putative sugar kinase YdjH [Clostridium ragsdalei P11]|uniref:Putative sugar kinase YdjH n=1 Tax=Clostridium ragsdalei P11 TaxID=1353534 RepID=A0A1A6AWC5_9CLOT|nr:PfkB family carbohydrate kinase [Clostridium ragsdalei]OBR94386.1 putative sugar kinase YdjH [Clostridium ragsdalei P11]